MSPSAIHDDTICLLGEGPMWHPLRGELFWFDILGRTLHRRGQHWRFDRIVTAAGWIDEDRLLIASDRALSVFTLSTGKDAELCPLEADVPGNRSNDGRADPQGGFWIGTMGLDAEQDAGAIWRWYRGELRRLFAPITIPNAICFAPDGRTAYFADTPQQVIRRVTLDDQGWPVGESAIHIDLRGTGHFPDGAVVDSAGVLWNAQWGSFRVAAYDAAGREMAAIPFPAEQTSCPAFGGERMRTLFCTSAAAGKSQRHLVDHPESGRTFAARVDAVGQAEHRVIL
ncbi:MAG: SMP-30/gluconolactonase/LRE family protein [Rubellimicrobium sp.]|nr:SMP-30/gluconolactonase/LRE family protein [Rubellimicrobium sp.]